MSHERIIEGANAELRRQVAELQEQLETLREAHDVELDELRMQVVGAENDLRESEAIVVAAREFVGEEPVQLWLNRGGRLVGELADPKWKRLVIALADSYPATSSEGATQATETGNESARVAAAPSDSSASAPASIQEDR